MECKISFIVPVYNTPLDKMKKCISSILQVDSMTYEIVIVNDGSEEELSKNYEAYFQGMVDLPIKYVRQKNMGVSAARNTALSLAEGEYIMFVDSDDEIIPEALDDEYSADLVLFQHIFIKGRIKKKIVRAAISGESRTIPFEDLAWTVLCGKLRGACGLLYKSEFINTHGISFEKGCIQGEDADFNFRFIFAKPSCQFIKKPVYIYLFSTKTAQSRWQKMPDKMLTSGVAHFERAVEYLPVLLAEDIDSKKREIIIKRIQNIYRNGIELCCAGQATNENKRLVEQMMALLVLPEDVDGKTKRQYMDIVNRKWYKLAIVAWIRKSYLLITGI